MSIEGQGHFFTIYFPGFVCFVLYSAKISGERLQDHWSSGFIAYSKAGFENTAHMSLIIRKPVFRVSDQVSHKPGCTATEDG